MDYETQSKENQETSRSPSPTDLNYIKQRKELYAKYRDNFGMFIEGTFPSEVETMHNEVETMHKEAGELIVNERKLLKNTDCGMIDFDLAATIDVKDIEGHADVLNERREDGETLLESVYPEAVAARDRTNKKIIEEVRAEH